MPWLLPPLWRGPNADRSPPIRLALYFAPAPDDPLARTAAAWLGRDPWGEAPLPRPAVPSFSFEDIERRTESARRYGFHATLKAPFRLAEGRGEGELAEALDAWARDAAPVTIPRLTLAGWDGFFALVPAAPSAALDRLAADIVAGFDAFRAPLTAEEVAKREPDRLSPAERENLWRWGYPHVMDQFRFHMTLTDRLEQGEREGMRAVLEAVFTDALQTPLAVDRLVLFREKEKGAPFAAVREFPLRGTAA